jgi:transketolase
VFAVNKGFEQMRVCAAYGRSNLKVVGTHSGISIGEDGPSQMSVEEIALACSLVGFVVIAPADEPSCKALVRAAAAHDGPVFLRAGRPKAPVIYGPDQKFEIGKAIEVAAGSDVTIIANGLLVAQALLAANILDSEGVSARVIDMHTVKPLDREAIAKAAAETAAIVVAEEHLVDGGLGVKVAQVVGETHPCAMEFVGIHDRYAESGQPDEMLEKCGLVARDVAAAARKVLARKR